VPMLPPEDSNAYPSAAGHMGTWPLAETQKQGDRVSSTRSTIGRQGSLCAGLAHSRAWPERSDRPPTACCARKKSGGRSHFQAVRSWGSTDAWPSGSVDR
jgi:hypothetical protein